MLLIAECQQFGYAKLARAARWWRTRLDSRVFTICCVLILQPVLFGCDGDGVDIGPPPLSDGTIVYRESIDDGVENIFVSPTPTANEQRINIGAILVPASYELGPGLNLRSPSQFALIVIARWSPDGAKIALGVGGAVFLESSQLIVLDRDGSNAKLASPQLFITDPPTWSPDGSQLFYTMAKGPSYTNIGLFVSNLDTDTATEIALPFQSPPNGFRGLQWSSEPLMGPPTKVSCISLIGVAVWLRLWYR